MQQAMAFSGLAKLTLFCLSIVTAQGRSFVVPSFSQPASRQSIDGDQRNDTKPTISRFHINSNIEFRYARTTVESYVKNPSLTSQEVTFTAIIPNSAFISNFSMAFDGVEYVATVAPKEEAKKVYEEAVTAGRGAGLVSQDVRDSNKFMVSANVEPQAKVVFKMTYEELLERKFGWYEHVINVNPRQAVNDLKIVVNIDESRPLDKLSLPALKQSNEIDFEPGQQNEIAQVNWEKGNATARIEFAPTKEQQEEYGEQGMTGQLLVKYAVERDEEANEIQVIDGYFVHFFTPENLETLPKHVIFVLDISGSMSGDKIIQLKDAMFTILNDMTEQDYFNIITFSYSFSHWELPSNVIANDHHDYTTEKNGMNKFNVIQATDENKRKAIKYTNSINANGGTNINDGLLEGLKLAAEAKKNEALPTNLQSIVVFLSHGEPTSGERNGNAIKTNVKNANLQLKVPIYSLGFGRGADFNLIKDISTDAGAFAKHIYEDSDAALQLEDFFAEIASPLLSDLKFNYVGGLVDNSSISQNHLATFYKGGEFIVTGKLQQIPPQEKDFLEVTVSASGENGTKYDHKASICLRPCALPGGDNMTDVNDIHYNGPLNPLLGPCPLNCFPPPPPPARSQAQNFLKNLHAFLNIKQLLKKTDGKEKALKLSLENNFVTELTSLIVTRPNQTAKISSLQDANEEMYVSKRESFCINQHCKPCFCSLEGSKTFQCDNKTGECDCNAGFKGRACGFKEYEDAGKNKRLDRTNAFVKSGRRNRNPPEMFPWGVSIGWVNKFGRKIWKHYCSGVIVSINYIITTANCLTSIEVLGVPFSHMKVRAGDSHLKSPNDDGNVQTKGNLTFKMHPEYVYHLHYNDIAVIKLNEPFVLNEYVRPVYLPTPFEVINQTDLTNVLLSISGWGEGDGKKFGRRLRDAKIVAFPGSYCNSSVSSDRLDDKLFTNDVICGASPVTLEKVCQGDDGSPAVMLDSERRKYVLVALVSMTYEVDGKRAPCVTSKSLNTLVRVDSESNINFIYKEIYGDVETLIPFFKDMYGVTNHSEMVGSDPSEDLQCGRTNALYDSKDNGESNDSKWPWMVSLGIWDPDNVNQWDHFCGGIILSQDKVLTAAHCTKKYKDFFIRAGSDDLKSAFAKVVKVVTSDVHEKYTKPHRYFDVAILTLESPLARNIEPICLMSDSEVDEHSKDRESNTAMIVAGWGDGSNNQLRDITVKVFSEYICNTTYKHVADNGQPNGFSDDLLCAGDPVGQAGTCGGDSGGGAVYFNAHKGRYFLRSIVSGSADLICGSYHYPNIFVRIEHKDILVNWIYPHIRI